MGSSCQPRALSEFPARLRQRCKSLPRTAGARVQHPFAWLRENRGTVAVAVVSITGAAAFFVYCQLRWGHWDIYMITQSAGWGIEPDYLAVFRPSSYRWLVPAFNNPTQASQMAMTFGAVFLLLAAALRAGASDFRRNPWHRIGLLFCAATIYFVSVSGVACVDMESMLRYEFSLHPLIVLAFLHFLRQFRTPPALVRFTGAVVVALRLRRRLMPARLVCVEFYEGQLGCLGKNENGCSDNWGGSRGIDGGLSSVQERGRGDRAGGRSGLCRRNFADRHLQGFWFRHRRPSVLFQMQGGGGSLDGDSA